MDDNFKKNLLSESVWLRAFYMIIFYFVSSAVTMILLAIVAIQFLFALITGSPNSNLVNFTNGATEYIFQIYRFLTFNSDIKPFPFTRWPTSKNADKSLVSDSDNHHAD